MAGAVDKKRGLNVAYLQHLTLTQSLAFLFYSEYLIYYNCCNHMQHLLQNRDFEVLKVHFPVTQGKMK
jgi:hypothetical protein